jgi:hypothetical protein
MSSTPQKKPVARQYPAETAGGPKLKPVRAPKAAVKPADEPPAAAGASPSQKEEVILKLIEFLKSM